MYQRHVSDRVTSYLGFQGFQEKEKEQKGSNAFSRTSLDSHRVTSHQKLLPMGTCTPTPIRRTGEKLVFRFSQEERDFQIMTFERSREGMTYSWYMGNTWLSRSVCLPRS